MEASTSFCSSRPLALPSSIYELMAGYTADDRMCFWSANNKALRRLTIVYIMVAIWAFGWLAATFGFLPSVLAEVILVAPVYFAWRMITGNRPIERSEYGYLSVVATLSIAATVYLALNWYGAGMDRLAMFDREFREFRRHVASSPEYKKVELSYTHRKGGRVYMNGAVGSQYSHDRLIQDIESMVRNNYGGYYDGVSYPGKAKAGDT
jgi:hypothetical protein